MIRTFVRDHKEKLMYTIAGGWNTVFGYGVFAFLYYVFLSRVSYIVILTLSYVISITNAYIGYKIFVFRTRGNIVREYFRFYLVYGGAYVSNVVLLPLFIEYLSINAYVAQLVITILNIAGSYVMHKKFTFKS